MAKFFVQMSIDNAAFGDEPSAEIARILRDIADIVEADGAPDRFANCRDVNGNTVGTYAIKPDGYAVKE